MSQLGPAETGSDMRDGWTFLVLDRVFPRTRRLYVPRWVPVVLVVIVVGLTSLAALAGYASS